eukprot:2928100-Amphidinium_carterae.1
MHIAVFGRDYRNEPWTVHISYNQKGTLAPCRNAFDKLLKGPDKQKDSKNILLLSVSLNNRPYFVPTFKSLRGDSADVQNLIGYLVLPQKALLVQRSDFLQHLTLDSMLGLGNLWTCGSMSVLSGHSGGSLILRRLRWSSTGRRNRLRRCLSGAWHFQKKRRP